MEQKGFSLVFVLILKVCSMGYTCFFLGLTKYLSKKKLTFNFEGFLKLLKGFLFVFQQRGFSAVSLPC